MTIEILAPMSGRVVPLEEVADDVFAQRMAGDGLAVIPDGGQEVLAPVGGSLVKLFEGGHAFGIATPEGLELIVHVGLDTVGLRGRGFERLATEGDEVAAGQPIVRFDLEAIREAGLDPASPVLVTNPESFPVAGGATGAVAAGEVLYRAGP